LSQWCQKILKYSPSNGVVIKAVQILIEEPNGFGQHQCQKADGFVIGGNINADEIISFSISVMERIEKLADGDVACDNCKVGSYPFLLRVQSKWNTGCIDQKWCWSS